MLIHSHVQIALEFGDGLQPGRIVAREKQPCICRGLELLYSLSFSKPARYPHPEFKQGDREAHTAQTSSHE